MCYLCWGPKDTLRPRPTMEHRWRLSRSESQTTIHLVTKQMQAPKDFGSGRQRLQHLLDQADARVAGPPYRLGRRWFSGYRDVPKEMSAAVLRLQDDPDGLQHADHGRL